jgi:5-methylcytosine-specific restriction endonuclease McrA
MFRSFPKRVRIRLHPKEYKALCLQVLDRDEWTCRRCSSRQRLQVHHLIKRSELRLDVSSNLVVLCADCHELVERHKVDVIGADADLKHPAPGALLFRPTEQTLGP